MPEASPTAATAAGGRTGGMMTAGAGVSVDRRVGASATASASAMGLLVVMLVTLCQLLQLREVEHSIAEENVVHCELLSSSRGAQSCVIVSSIRFSEGEVLDDVFPVFLRQHNIISIREH